MSEDGSRRSVLRYATIGTEFGLTIILMVGAGYLLDRWLGSLPGFTIIGMIAGLAIGLYRLIRRARAAAEELRPPEPPKEP